jgi:hypothetical protein
MSLDVQNGQLLLQSKGTNIVHAKLVLPTKNSMLHLFAAKVHKKNETNKYFELKKVKRKKMAKPPFKVF